MRNYPITPHAYRQRQRGLKEDRANYVAARRAALAAKASYRAARTGISLIDREDALGAALEARRSYYITRRWVENAVVEVGAAWSPRGLARVRAANARRGS